MRIAFILGHAAFYRHFDGVVRRLCAAGHSVIVVRGAVEKSNVTDTAIHACASETGRVTIADMLQTERRWQRLRSRVRGMRGYAVYLRRGHPSPSLAYRRVSEIPRLAAWMVCTRPGRMLLGTHAWDALLSRIEQRIPADPAILDWLRRARPDVLVASPYITTLEGEVDYAKAARLLGIPTVVAVASWDNLTTKGTFLQAPDYTLVWNAALRDEAISLHWLPSNRVLVTGAPTFDEWFGRQPAIDRATFCTRVGLRPDRPYVTYLCSSQFIAGDETSHVRAFWAALRAKSATRDVGLLVRPHPLNASAWSGAAHHNLVIWPRGGAFPETDETKDEYFATLYHAAAVVGVNTTGFLDAAVVGRPCVALPKQHDAMPEPEIGHFRHLLAGRFLEVASDLERASTAVGQIVQGEDPHATHRRRFVQDFIRPWGVDVPASAIMARALEAVAANPALTPVALQRAFRESASDPKFELAVP